MSCKLNSYYITGFVDGEGFFIVSVNPYSRHSTGYKVKATFSINLHKRDLLLLMLIKEFLVVGSITNSSTNGIQYRISNLQELELIISHFENYPLMYKKFLDFLLFK